MSTAEPLKKLMPPKKIHRMMAQALNWMILTLKNKLGLMLSMSLVTKKTPLLDNTHTHTHPYDCFC